MQMAHVPLLHKYGRAPSICQGTAVGSRPWLRTRAATAGGGQQHPLGHHDQLNAKQLAAACSLYRLAAAAASAGAEGYGRAGAAEARSSKARSSTAGPDPSAAADVVLGRWRLGVQAAAGRASR